MYHCGYKIGMGQKIGKPFSEISGPGVWLVNAMQDLEVKLREMGMEVEYKVQGDNDKFEWTKDS